MKRSVTTSLRLLGIQANKMIVGVTALAILAAAAPAAAETPTEASNKRLVSEFYAALNQADATGLMSRSIQPIAEKYLAENYVQHSEMFANLPGPGSARDKLIRMFQSMPAGAASSLPPQQTVALMAEGELVMILTSRTFPSTEAGPARVSYTFNLFRLEDGKLVEHWDSSAPPPGMSGPPPG